MNSPFPSHSSGPSSFGAPVRSGGVLSSDRPRARKALIIRLSSLGDVILASGALSTLDSRADWVVASEFAGILRGHPRVGRLWEFDRKTGLRGWWHLCRNLRAEGYDLVLDLHGSLRSKLARWFFRILPGNPVTWSRIRKYRFRLWGLYLFKARWPKRWRPPSKIEEVSRVSLGLGRPPGLEASGKPDFRFFLTSEAARNARARLGEELSEPYYCVMPASRWQGKQWPVSRYIAVIEGLQSSRPELGTVVVLGTEKDSASKTLVSSLRSRGHSHVDGVGRWDLAEVAGVLGGATAYLGSDTGLAHLAEALGVRAWMVFGPTVPEMGFGPWRAESLAIGRSLWCRPCGKDGRSCHRISDRYSCMKGLEARHVLDALISAADSVASGRER